MPYNGYPGEYYKDNLLNIKYAHPVLVATGQATVANNIIGNIIADWESLISGTTSIPSINGADIPVYCPDCGREFTQAERDATFIDPSQYIFYHMLQCPRCNTTVTFTRNTAYGISKE